MSILPISSLRRMLQFRQGLQHHRTRGKYSRATSWKPDPPTDQQVTTIVYGVYLRHPGSQTTLPTSPDSASGTTITRIRNGSNYLFGETILKWSVVSPYSMQRTIRRCGQRPDEYDRQRRELWLNP